jgi:hypothetical protein
LKAEADKQAITDAKAQQDAVDAQAAQQAADIKKMEAFADDLTKMKAFSLDRDKAMLTWTGGLNKKQIGALRTKLKKYFDGLTIETPDGKGFVAGTDGRSNPQAIAAFDSQWEGVGGGTFDITPWLQLLKTPMPQLSAP